MLRQLCHVGNHCPEPKCWHWERELTLMVRSRQAWSPLPGESWSIQLNFLTCWCPKMSTIGKKNHWDEAHEASFTSHGRLAKPLRSLGLADVFGEDSLVLPSKRLRRGVGENGSADFYNESSG